MVKKVGPDLNIEIPNGKDCEDCDGNGAIKGAFFLMPCNACNAVGELHKDTGEQIDTSVALITLRRQNKALARENRKLKARIQQLEKNQPSHDPYGKLKTRHGGKYRGD